MKISFLSFTCEDIGVAMVTNMISQLQESFPLRRAAGSFEISFKTWLRGAKAVRLPVTLSMSCQIFTTIYFPSWYNILEDLPKLFYVEISPVSYLYRVEKIFQYFSTLEEKFRISVRPCNIHV